MVGTLIGCRGTPAANQRARHGGPILSHISEENKKKVICVHHLFYSFENLFTLQSAMVNICLMY